LDAVHGKQYRAGSESASCQYLTLPLASTHHGKMLNKPTKVPVHFFFHCLPLAQFIFFPKNMGDAQAHLGPGLCTFWACDGLIDVLNLSISMWIIDSEISMC